MNDSLWQKINQYQATNYRTDPVNRLKTIEEAVQFVNEIGFLAFWPMTGIPMPSLWSAVAGNRPVADGHDDPGHITWGWKDDMLGKKQWFYGRVLGHRNAFISLEYLPYFYALSPNYGDYQNDYLDQYEMGLLKSEAKTIYECLLHQGPLDTLALRKASHLNSSSSDYRFQHAIDQLQKEFKVLPVGISPVGAWKYAFLYDITPRHFSTLEEQTRSIQEAEARQKILTRYMLSVAAATESQILRLFNWIKPDYLKTLKKLSELGIVQSDVEIPSQKSKMVILSQLLRI